MENPMGYLKFARYAIPGLLLAATATAQSRPGVTFDETTSTVTMTAAGIDSSINVMHMTSAGSDIRADLERGNFVKSIGPFSPGPHAVMIARGAGAQIVFLNPDEKQYLSMKPLEMMQGAQKMMEGMGGSMAFDTSVTRITLDSVGPGSSIDGHPTLTYRLTTVMKLTVSIMGQQNVVNDQSTQEIQAATDMGDFTQVNSFSELAQSMGFAKGFFDKVVATRQKIRGFPLRSVKHSTGSANGQSRTSVETAEIRNVKHLTVPDSLFAIPGDYKPVSFPGMPGTGN
jgi:hypothetical protein